MNTDIRRLHDSASLQLFLKLAIKCSDVGHAVKKWEMHDLWSQRVVQVVVGPSLNPLMMHVLTRRRCAGVLRAGRP